MKKYEKGQRYYNDFLVDDFYVDRKATEDTIVFINAHIDFFYDVFNAPNNLIGLMKKNNIEKSPLLKAIKDAFHEGNKYFPIWMAVAQFREAINEYFHSEDNIANLANFLQYNPAINKALVGLQEHHQDPLILAWYSCQQEQVKRIEPEAKTKPVNTESNWIDELSLFASDTVSTIYKGFFGFSATDKGETESKLVEFNSAKSVR